MTVAAPLLMLVIIASSLVIFIVAMVRIHQRGKRD
jgi:hypothetical protein